MFFLLNSIIIVIYTILVIRIFFCILVTWFQVQSEPLPKEAFAESADARKQREVAATRPESEIKDAKPVQILALGVCMTDIDSGCYVDR